MPGVLIKPITVRLLTYGQKANVAAIRKRASDLLRDEHGAADPAAFTELSAADVHAEIVATRWDSDTALKKPTASQAGVAITLANVHERLTNEWMDELPVAKTCVVFASWTSQRDGSAWQLSIADGERHSDTRPAQ